MNTIFTIGHSQHPMKHFIELLNMHNINYVIDVRSTPYSKYAQEYDRENIKNILKQNNIEYCFMGKSFGARQDDRTLYTTSGYLDFEKVAMADKFNVALSSVKRGMENNNIALMCLEKAPIDCHRAILVGNAFYRANCNVEHILEDGILKNHDQLNLELLDLYFPDRNQISFFGNKSEDEYLKDAYKLRNKEVGYHIE